MRKPLYISSMFLSGAAALIYEIVWVRKLGDLLGQDVYAINVVLTIFFLGLGVGGWLFGRIADRVAGNIFLYIALEMTIAAAALAFDPALGLADGLVTRWAPAELSWQAGLGIASLACAMVLIVPTIAMGGTLAAMSRHVIVHDRQISGEFAWLYGSNTLGAAAGVFASTFLMIPRWGVGQTMRAAVALNIAAVLAAWLASRTARVDRPVVPPGPSTRVTPIVPSSRSIPLLIAFTTGFASVGFELLWTRGLSSRFTSGVYSFAIILCVYLLCIAAGSLLVDALDRRGWVSARLCAVVVVLTGLAGAASPAIIAQIPQTSGLYFGPETITFGQMEWLQCLRAFSVMALSLLMFGLALPMVVRLATKDVARIGASVGAIYLVNSIGAVVAPLVVGFFIMPRLGLGSSFAALGAMLVAAGLLLRLSQTADSRRRSVVTLAWIIPATAICFAVGLTSDVRAWRSHPDAKLVDYREGPSASVSVVDHPDRGRILQVNLGYTLGGSRGVFAQQRQGLWPFLLQPGAPSALVLGLGTGSTAGAAYEACRGEVDALEIIPEVVEMLNYYKAENFDLLARSAADPKLRILSVDGRHFVRATRRRYDVVIGDLFEPWRQGAGGLYSREHFDSIARLLPDDGTFWQWLPLYQLADPELRTIARTFCDVFPYVEVWWLEFNAEHPAIAIVGGKQARTINRADLERRFNPKPAPLWVNAGFLGPGPALGSWICNRETLVAYAGEGPINTTDHPLIEFDAPRSLVNRAADWGAANMHRMFELAQSVTEPQRAAIFPQADVRQAAQRYRPAVEHMMTAHEKQLAQQTVDAGADAITAMTLTPEWGYPVEFMNMTLTAALESPNADDPDKLIAKLDEAPVTKTWAAYWRARKSLRDGDPKSAREHLRDALRINPNHQAAANLLAELQRQPAQPTK